MDYTLSLKELHDHWNLFLANVRLNLYEIPHTILKYTCIFEFAIYRLHDDI